MGLDMYAFTAPRGSAMQPVDFEPHEDANLIHKWRKHPNLHGWMESLYYAKGGVSEVFNCNTVELTLDDLARLEEAVIARTLPETSGCFFGETDGSETDDDLVFIAKAREAIANGLAVFYDSWW